MRVDEFQEQLRRWRDLERDALAAEEALKAAGQFAPSPEHAALARQAVERRRLADDFLSEMLGTVRNRSPGSDGARDDGG